MTDRKEYIERGALLQDIEETALFTVRGGEQTPTSEMRGARKVIGRIEAAPTTDVVEVVRCGECKGAIPLQHSDYVVCCGCRKMPKNGFCNYGERKDGADNAAD